MLKTLGKWAAGLFLFVQGLATIWPTVSKDTVPDWLTRQTWLTSSGTTLLGYASLLIGAAILFMIALERWRPREDATSTLSMAAGSMEHKRHLLATYYMHALRCRDAIVNDTDAAAAKLHEFDNKLNAMREELRAATDWLSHDTCAEFSEPRYVSGSVRERVIENAEHMMAKANRKWNAWGGNTAATPLASRKKT